MPRPLATVSLLATLTLLSGCSLFVVFFPQGVDGADAGGPSDAGGRVTDSGGFPDGGTGGEDAGRPADDAGALMDGGAQPQPDGGRVDSGYVVDAGAMIDAGFFDGGFAVDAGRGDAGAVAGDAGLPDAAGGDAGMPACGAPMILNMQTASLSDGKGSTLTLPAYSVSPGLDEPTMIIAVSSEVEGGDGLVCAIESASYGATALQRDGFALENGGENKCAALFSLLLASSGIADVTIETGIQSESINAVVYVATCLDRPRYDTAIGRTGPSESVLVTSVDTGPGASIIVDAFAHGANVVANLAPDAPQTLIGRISTANEGDLGATGTVGASYRVVDGPDTFTMGWSANAANVQNHVVAAFPLRP